MTDVDYGDVAEVDGENGQVDDTPSLQMMTETKSNPLDPMASELMLRILDTFCTYWTEMRSSQSPLLSGSPR